MRLSHLLAALPLFFVTSFSAPALADEPQPSDWPAVEAAAEGQTVYWNAWGGEGRINDYIAWVGEQVKARYGVTLEHVKLSDTAEAVSRVLAEKQAGRDTGGAVDLIWINGENFAAMKRQDLLFGPWSEEMPNYTLVDTEGKPTTRTDFTVPVDGLEAPWGMAQIVFYYDTERLPEPPTTVDALLTFAAQNPGRFTYPQPPDFLGSTFLKQVLYATIDDTDRLLQPVDEARLDADLEGMWQYLNKLHPVMWREGKVFPQGGPAQRQLMADGEIDVAVSFSPSEASTAIANFELPDTVRTFVFDRGTIGNTHFVAIPYNAAHKAGAMVVANFLMSPEAQLRKQDPEVWGDGTVLNMDAISVEQRAGFDALELGIATLGPAELGTPLLEPHPSWMERIEDEWVRRYGTGQ
ncbi:MAG: ABC transporter substrate-binding protein [Alphaproteobacteria bacterium]|nr:ABC transporter substrate-binding protein [Alphaproteobacteria bacterium SS10]